jgi:hypothetical protein
MSTIFKSLVSEDSADAWQALKNGMPWTDDDLKVDWLKELDFELVDSDEEEDPGESGLGFENLPTYSEDYLDPVIVIADDFYPYIQTCLSISLVQGRNEEMSSSEVCIQTVAGDLYKSRLETSRELPFSLVSYLLVACPRCQLSFSADDESFEFDPDEEDWIQEDCIACKGTGEWEWELI